MAAEWAGFTTVGQCEWADYPTKVLEKHWPNVPRWRDIRELTYDKFVERTGLRTVDLISGGFPCQPFSVAGKQKGKRDDRYLWPEMLRVIREIKPTWVLGENVPGILSIAGKTVCEDLEREGYAVAVFNFEAAAVGAPHRRDRVFFVAHSTSLQCDTRAKKQRILRTVQKNRREYDYSYIPSETRGEIVADTSSTGLQGTKQRPNNDTETIRRSQSTTRPTAERSSYVRGYWTVEPNVGRVAHGVPFRVDRLKCLGNAVVPQQAYPIFQAIADIENMEAHNEK